MALEAKLSLRQTQRMIMTQSLQQAIGLLQLTRMELIQTVRQELEENPLLEEELVEAAEEVPETKTEAAAEEPAEPEREEKLSETDWEAYLQDASDYRREFPREELERAGPEETMTRPRSLADHLTFQLYLSTSDPSLIAWANLIIGNLDENGYLTVPLAELNEEPPADPSVPERALRLVQSFDPVGVAARDLGECLLVQLDARGAEARLARCLISEHLAELEHRNIARLADRLKVPPREVQVALELIASLEPKPGRTFSTDEPRYITPDVYILKVDDRFVVVLNEDGLPRLRVSGYYRAILSRRSQNSKETREYVEGKMRSALWLIRSIEQRQRTLYKVTESIVKFQRPFLEQGISAMRPLTLKEVAEDIGMHESTVSRVTTNKYVHSPQGLFELKYFFHRGVPATDGGGTVSSLTVKEIVRKLLTQEDQGKPLSDQKIVEILQQQGVEIARRTVAKYRSQLRIPSSSKRRRY
ncbi:MAG TPA: RNA polymerase factor sigma-54 [Candidatus Methylomirabilis sp.]|jgi:RNA polymerase sigma-54 factor|nr:RNA polymerase factor sigma-54 [Candidatus Methylomirabilis sp.]